MPDESNSGVVMHPKSSITRPAPSRRSDDRIQAPGGPCKAISTPANEIEAIDFDPRIVPQICDGLRRGYIDEEQVIVVHMVS
jgi:hypothetical protein